MKQTQETLFFNIFNHTFAVYVKYYTHFSYLILNENSILLHVTIKLFQTHRVQSLCKLPWSWIKALCLYVSERRIHVKVNIQKLYHALSEWIFSIFASIFSQCKVWYSAWRNFKLSVPKINGLKRRAKTEIKTWSRHDHSNVDI